MNNNIFNQMLKKYTINNQEDEENAIKEIIQEIILCALSRANFFDEAAFYGGTALRIFYGLDRFSEDLDFSLLKPNKDFDITKYFDAIKKEAMSYGLDVEITKKVKTNSPNIESAFLKSDTYETILLFFGSKSLIDNTKILKDIRIKFEIDINPPKNANYEFKYRLLPSPYEVRLYDDESLFAGKIHAILCRNWHLRTKGRDLYDYIFHLTNNTKINLKNLESKLKESNFISEDEILTLDKVKSFLKDKFSEINYEDAKKDVLPFIKNASKLNLWSKEFFINITDNLN